MNSEPIFIRPPGWDAMSEEEQLRWATGFLRSALAARRSEDPKPDPPAED